MSVPKKNCSFFIFHGYKDNYFLLNDLFRDGGMTSYHIYWFIFVLHPTQFHWKRVYFVWHGMTSVYPHFGLMSFAGNLPKRPHLCPSYKCLWFSLDFGALEKKQQVHRACNDRVSGILCWCVHAYVRAGGASGQHMSQPEQSWSGEPARAESGQEASTLILHVPCWPDPSGSWRVSGTWCW